MKKKLMITGSFPPDICGVGDYTSCFMSSHDTEIENWSLYYSKEWSLKLLKKKISVLNSYNTESIFLQYPTQGYGWSLLPQIICIYYSIFTNKKFVVILHEFSQRSLKAKLATLFLFFANEIIFTTDFERNYSKKLFPFISKRFHTIKILSNIKAVKDLHKWEDRKYDLMYFGHIRPSKGLEDVFQVVLDLQRAKTVKVAIVGQVLSEFESYFTDLKGKYKEVIIDYYLNETSDLVSCLLNNAKIVFLPFPDGISERRGSFLAAITNGALVVTYRGRFVTSSLKCICFFTTPNKASIFISHLLESITKDDYTEKRLLQKRYLENELPSSWSSIVKLYNEVVEHDS